ncbi:MAG: hypothetical protein LV479_05050 [Methylacidiphilales bacterium]|nr:hypothetical protein [Candidatus Methylacidiphilales bacterium]
MPLRDFIGPIELLHEQAGPRLLRLARLGIFSLWIVKLLLDPLWRLVEMPREMFSPVGILNLFPAGLLDTMMTPAGLTVLLVLSIISSALCLTDRAFALTATVAAFFLTVYSSVIRCFGPAVHTDVVLLLAVYVLAGFAWADLIAGKKGPKWGAWSSYPLFTIAVLLCLSYCLVGFNRALVGGPRLFLGDTMEVWAIDASLRGYYFNTNVGWHTPEWPVVALMLKLGLPVVTLFEMGAPVCLVSPRFRLIFIPVMLSFHALSLVFMNIFFFDDMLLYLLLIDWSRYYPGLRAFRQPSAS